MRAFIVCVLSALVAVTSADWTSYGGACTNCAPGSTGSDCQVSKLLAAVILAMESVARGTENHSYVCLLVRSTRT